MPVPTNEVTMGRQFETAERVGLVLIAAGGAQDLFVITGGPIYLERLTGIVTVLCGADGRIDTHLQIVPDAGVAPGVPVVMCDDTPAAALDMDTLDVDSQINITGAVAVAAVATITGVVVAPSFMTNHQILAPGTLQLVTVDIATTGNIVGALTWTIVYRPLVEGVSVVAA